LNRGLKKNKPGQEEDRQDGGSSEMTNPLHGSSFPLLQRELPKAIILGEVPVIKQTVMS
jgi:hypothetical protein